MAGRKRTGSLVWTRNQWSARIAGGKLTPLHTPDRDLAKVRLSELVHKGTAPGPGAENFQEACTRIVAALARDGMRTADERLSRLRRFAWPQLGALRVTEIRPGQISAVLAAAAELGLAQDTINHLQVDISKVFAELERDEVVTGNPASAKRVRIPKVGRDKRKRVLLTDAEFFALVQAPTTPPQLAAMSVCSRCFGGLRPSDIYAWQWEDIDLEGWQWADAPRPKTEHHADETDAPRERLQLPEIVAATLRQWHAVHGAPIAGPLFPIFLPALARYMRAYLIKAGVTRHEVHHDTPKSRRADFYSFRRAFVTAVGASGLNHTTSMRLAGHKNMSTHQRYNAPVSLAIPNSAVPFQAGDTETDFETALENFNPVIPTTILVHGFGQLCRNTEENDGRLRPSYAEQDTAHIHSTCQDKTN